MKEYIVNRGDDINLKIYEENKNFKIGTMADLYNYIMENYQQNNFILDNFNKNELLGINKCILNYAYYKKNNLDIKDLDSNVIYLYRGILYINDGKEIMLKNDQEQINEQLDEFNHISYMRFSQKYKEQEPYAHIRGIRTAYGYLSKGRFYDSFNGKNYPFDKDYMEFVERSGYYCKKKKR